MFGTLRHPLSVHRHEVSIQEELGLVSIAPLGYGVCKVRFRSKPLAALSILLILAGALGSWHDPDDRDGDSAPVAHHHTNHDERFTPATHPEAPAHCAFCHWLRSLGNGAPVTVQAVSSAPPSLVRPLAVLEDVQTRDRLALPSRAPPLA